MKTNLHRDHRTHRDQYLASYPKEAPPDIPDERLRRIRDTRRNAKAPRTLKEYEKHWRYYNDWCKTNDPPLQPLPASPYTVADYLIEYSQRVGISAIKVASAAIAHYHRRNMYQSPTTDVVVIEAVEGIARGKPMNPNPTTGIDVFAFAAIVRTAYSPAKGETQEDTNRRASFDLALLSLMRDALLRRTEAARVRWRHIQIHRDPDGNEFGILHIPSSKTDPAGQGATQFISGYTIKLLNNMILHRKGRPPDPQDLIFNISDRQIAKRIKKMAKRAGLKGNYSGHSPRRGMTEDLARDNTSLANIMKEGRWKSHKMPAVYSSGVLVHMGAVAQWHLIQEHPLPELHGLEVAA